VEALMHVIGAKEPAAEIDLPGEIKARRVYQKLIIQPDEGDGGKVQPYHCPLEVPGRFHLHQAGWVVETHLETVSEMPCISKPKNRFEAYFDWDMMQNSGPLVVRTRRDGDRVALFGLNGAKKVKDIFIDAKVPRLLRDNYPIVSQGETILWVPGLARSRYYLVHETSRQILIIRLYNMK
jgi:tRNA(Ile)-lysidine synthase